MQLKLHTIKFLDRVLGPLVIALMPRSQTSANVGPGNKFLFIRPGGIGDAVLLLPAIGMLKKRFPLAQIDVLAERRNSGVFLLTEDIGTIYRYDRPVELFATLNSSYDVVIDTEQWYRMSAVVARTVRSAHRIGFATNERARLFTQTVPYSHDDYEVESFLHLTETVTGKMVYDAAAPFADISHSHISKGWPLDTIGKFVCLFPGGTIPERQWGGERFHELAEAFGKMGYAVVVVGGKGDRRTAENIVRDLPSGVNLAGNLSLRDSAAVIKRSSLLVTGDSGIMHLGYALGAKVVALFGPGIEKKWAPRSSRVAVINKRLPCSPCTKFGTTPRCPRNSACMREIRVQEVLDRSLELLNR